MFWKDKWLNQTLQMEFSESYSFVKNKSIWVNKAFSLHSLTEMFNLPLSQVAFNQMQTLQQMMETMILETEDDSWAYIGGSTKYSS